MPSLQQHQSSLNQNGYTQQQRQNSYHQQSGQSFGSSIREWVFLSSGVFIDVLKD
jgi:hypothetical protein